MWNDDDNVYVKNKMQNTTQGRESLNELEYAKYGKKEEETFSTNGINKDRNKSNNLERRDHTTNNLLLSDDNSNTSYRGFNNKGVSLSPSPVDSDSSPLSPLMGEAFAVGGRELGVRPNNADNRVSKVSNDTFPLAVKSTAMRQLREEYNNHVSRWCMAVCMTIFITY